MLHPDDRARHRAIVGRAGANGTGYESEFRIVRPDNGAVVWMEERGNPVLDKRGRVEKFVGVVSEEGVGTTFTVRLPLPSSP